MDPEIARELSVVARNMAAQGYDDATIFRRLAAIHEPFDSALFFRARSRGRRLFEASGLSDTSPWPLDINFPYPLPPSLGAAGPYRIFATVKVEIDVSGDTIFKELLVEMANDIAGATARALIDVDAAALAAVYEGTLVSWQVDFWR